MSNVDNAAIMQHARKESFQAGLEAGNYAYRRENEMLKRQNEQLRQEIHQLKIRLAVGS